MTHRQHQEQWEGTALFSLVVSSLITEFIFIYTKEPGIAIYWSSLVCMIPVLCMAAIWLASPMHVCGRNELIVAICFWGCVAMSQIEGLRTTVGIIAVITGFGGAILFFIGMFVERTGEGWVLIFPSIIGFVIGIGGLTLLGILE